MAIFTGVGINFGINSTLSGVTGSFQSRDHNSKSETELIKNGTGDITAKVYFSPSEEATFNYIATGTSGGNITITLPSVGSFITITDTVYTAIAGTNWLIDDVSTSSTNTGATRVTLKLSKYSNITNS